MISSRKEYLYYLEADRIAKGIPKNWTCDNWIKSLLYPDYIWKFQKTLRKFEYYTNCKKGLFNRIYRIFISRKFNKLSRINGFGISPNVFGPGLSIAHSGTIIVNGGAKIGKNCRLHACVNIGTEAGYVDRAPRIGDNCYIGPGVKMYGAIILGDGIAIGANAVVNRSFIEKNIAIAGVPAKKIANIDTSNFIINATDTLDL